MHYYLANKTDEELWDLMRQSSKLAFSLLYKRYVHILYNFGKKITSDTEIISDTIQELFTELWEKRNTVNEVNYVKIYLIKSFRYKLIRTISKSKKYEQQLTFEELLIETPDWDDSMETSNIERRKILKTQLEQLPKRQREVIHLRYYHNLDNEEIAEIININYQSVSNLLHRAIKKIRSNIKKQRNKLPLF